MKLFTCPSAMAGGISTWSIRRKAKSKTRSRKASMSCVALKTAGWEPPEVFVAKGRDGKTDIWGIICRPRNFDPNKKYPVIEDIYAGPQGSFVPKTFGPTRRYASLTDLGFVVAKVDGMGTANRSKAFHDVCWKNLKDAGFEVFPTDRKSTRLNSSHGYISYAVFCLK